MKQHRKFIASRRRQDRRLRIDVKRSAVVFVAVMMLVGVMSPMFSNPPAEALDNSAKITALESQIKTYNARASELAAQSDSLSKAI